MIAWLDFFLSLVISAVYWSTMDALCRMFGHKGNPGLYCRRCSRLRLNRNCH